MTEPRWLLALPVQQEPNPPSWCISHESVSCVTDPCPWRDRKFRPQRLNTKGGRRIGLITATCWVRSRRICPGPGVRNSGSGLHQATDSSRITTTLLYPKRFPPLV